MKNSQKTMAFSAKLLFFLFVFFGCTHTVMRQSIPPTEARKVDKASEFLKAHLRDGRVMVFTKWTIHPDKSMIAGECGLLDFNRELIRSGQDSIHFDDISLIETNKIESSGGAMTFMTVLSVGVTLSCMANPKACFGSCPTFYVSDENGDHLVAEGFSSSILPSLEETDIDALHMMKPAGSTVKIQMTNEAFETHVVRYVNLLAIPRTEGEQVFVSPAKEFFGVRNVRSVRSAVAPEGECTNLLRSFDAKERFSPADEHNLAQRETLTVHFDNVPDGDVGLIVGFRETLLSTYLFYQTLAYAGNHAVQWLAQCERDPFLTARFAAGYYEVLGGIKVLVETDDGNWVNAGEIHESGPIARNMVILPLPPLARVRSIRLVMAKGRWRLDFIALGEIVGKDIPVRVPVSSVTRNGVEDRQALEILRDETRQMATFPGEALSLTYELPQNGTAYELFLESRGYYLEWIREEWKKEENLEKAMKAFLAPEEFVIEEAPRFKAQEATMEETFWRSRYVRQQEN